jgi:ribosomal protein L11 methyltransferase
MHYFEFQFKSVKDETESALVIAFLMDLGFESFTEEDEILIAYLPETLYRKDLLAENDFNRLFPDLHFIEKQMEDKNWNEEWERNYQPVLISGKCYVRAPFHDPVPGTRYDIVIEPKMAFGTAHHETTRLMAEWLMELDVDGKTVLDMGCGTGVLAILANKMGASFVTGIDNDEWAYRNSMENFGINGVRNGEVRLGDALSIGQHRYDLILANINRNILVGDMGLYAAGLKPGGLILLSGFYESDRDSISTAASAPGLAFQGMRTLNRWAVMLFKKSDP